MKKDVYKIGIVWYFPFLLLIGSLILFGFAVIGCGIPGSHTSIKCARRPCSVVETNPRDTLSTSEATAIATETVTIIETPISKVAQEAYVLISSSDSLDAGRTLPNGSHLHIELTPEGSLVNGQRGKMLAFDRIYMQDDIGLKEIPPGPYRIVISGTDAAGRALNICLSYNDNEPAHTQELPLQDGLLGVKGQSMTLLQVMMCPV